MLRYSRLSPPVQCVPCGSGMRGRNAAGVQRPRRAAPQRRCFDIDSVWTLRASCCPASHSAKTPTGASDVVIVTEWNAFRSLDLSRRKALMASPVRVDLRNIYRRKEVEAEGFHYESVGTLAPAMPSDWQTRPNRRNYCRPKSSSIRTMSSSPRYDPVCTSINSSSILPGLASRCVQPRGK